MKTVYLSLGSNLDDRQSQIETALTRLAHPRLRVTRRSSCYETEPRDLVRQPWFLNIAVEAETTFFPMMLLNHIAQVEREMGRRRTVAKGPRLIDIDILLYGKFVVSSPKLTIPHERLHERRFVLEPLAELAPDLRHPVFRKSVREMLATVKDQQVRKVER
ncbi:MAG: 2-amino-4-hydroxy-6-hydroxymethyldihydropteridine diphosphokinase [Bryobacteraceae bacterium]